MRKRSLLVLFLTVFIDLIGFGMVIPFLAYYAREYGASGMTVGAVVGIYSIMQFFCAPVWGRLSDRIGRRPVILISLTASCLGYFMFAFAHSLIVLFASRVIAGAGGANIGTAQAYIADTTTREERAKGMGLIGAAFGMGFILGPPLSGVLAHVGTQHHMAGNLLPGLVAGSLSLTALLIAFLVLGESKQPDTTVRSGLPPQFDPQVWRELSSQTAQVRARKAHLAGEQAEKLTEEVRRRLDTEGPAIFVQGAKERRKDLFSLFTVRNRPMQAEGSLIELYLFPIRQRDLRIRKLCIGKDTKDAVGTIGH